MTKREWFYVPVNLKNTIIYYLKFTSSEWKLVKTLLTWLSPDFDCRSLQRVMKIPMS